MHSQVQILWRGQVLLKPAWWCQADTPDIPKAPGQSLGPGREAPAQGPHSEVGGSGVGGLGGQGGSEHVEDRQKH